MTTRTALAALCIGAFAVACSGRRGSSSTGSCKTYSACAVLTESDVRSATGLPVEAGAEDDLNVTPSAQLPEQVMCTYAGKSTDPFVSLRIRCCPCDDNDASSVPQVYAGDATTVTAVSGIGDAAFWVETTADAGLPVVDLLIVYVGADVQLVVSLSLPLGQGFPFDPLSAAKAMAAAARARL
jgi:hypothetical protein